MKSVSIIVFLIVFANSWCQEIVSTLSNNKIKEYHEDVNKARVLLSKGEDKRALNEIIEVLKLDLGYGMMPMFYYPNF